MSEAKAIRDEVAQSYTKAVSGASCCGTSCCGAEPTSETAKAAGYDPADLASLPADAVASSFGCGAPVAFAGIREGDTVLDLGSGAGIDLLLAAQKVGPAGKVIGVDMTDAMIERARANAARAGATQVEVRKGIIEELPVATESVDWVISNCVVNLSPEKDRVFREIARVLKPGGELSISDIVVEELPAALRGNPALRAACVAGAITEAEYLAGLRAAGLSEVRVEDRLVYDAAQIAGFLGGDELGELTRALPAEVVRALPKALDGKVWSARFRARR